MAPRPRSTIAPAAACDRTITARTITSRPRSCVARSPPTNCPPMPNPALLTSRLTGRSRSRSRSATRSTCVAIALRLGLADVETHLAGQRSVGDPNPVVEAGALGATCGGVRVWSLYVPHGRALDNPHYAYTVSYTHLTLPTN